MSVAALTADAEASPMPQSLVLVGPLPPPSGGMANQTRQLRRLLEAEGCRVTLVQTNAPYRPAWIGAVRGLRALVRLAPYVRALRRSVRGADVVHVMANSGWAWHLFAAPAVWTASLRGVPVVVNYRGGDAPAFLARQFRLVRPTLARCAAVIVPSGFLQEVFARHGVATTIVPNVVDLSAFRPAQARPEAPHLIVTRNLEAVYDIGTAIRAFAVVVRTHPQARLTIAGSGPERAALERLAGTQGVAEFVRFTGRLDVAALPALYASATAMLNPARIDNMPNSLLEAMASGVPIVSTNVGGVPHLVADGVTALLVPPGDPQAMAHAARRVIDDPHLAARLADAGAAESKRYAWGAVRPRLLAAYASAMRGAGPVATAA
ncbi:MAG: glycosyltransferase family 4 protein [Burkholderiales bacterium]|nr:glycosyltransferase family 4 protein [Burkholderiales bacterium]GIK85339.1 MAG: hypothetical protein BroJett026_08200 [Betaproteobacteria bacterium]